MNYNKRLSKLLMKKNKVASRVKEWLKWQLLKWQQKKDNQANRNRANTNIAYRRDNVPSRVILAGHTE